MALVIARTAFAITSSALAVFQPNDIDAVPSGNPAPATLCNMTFVIIQLFPAGQVKSVVSAKAFKSIPVIKANKLSTFVLASIFILLIRAARLKRYCLHIKLHYPYIKDRPGKSNNPVQPKLAAWIDHLCFLNIPFLAGSRLVSWLPSNCSLKDL